MPKKNILFLILFLFLIIPHSISAAYPAPADTPPTETGQTVNVYFFWSKTCPHCAKEKPFLESLIKKYDNIKLHSFEISAPGSADLLLAIGKQFNVDVSGVPFTMVGDRYFTGWYSQETTGRAIESAVQCALNNQCPDVLAQFFINSNLIKNNPPKKENIQPPVQQKLPEKISVPLFGQLNIEKISLPLLTLIIGALDGFNPCAMWVLIFLISLLLGMQDRKKMVILGSAFIAASAIVYFLFMAAWLNLFLFIGFIVWVRLLIGLIALASSGYNLRDYFKNKNGTCQITQNEKRARILDKLKKTTQQKKFWLALGGIIVLAFAVNLIELVCSAGLPAIYTQVLSLNHLPTWQYYAYLLFYILIFMLDDMIVFLVAVITLRATGLSNKYGRTSRLIGGILMLLLGLLLIFKPGWLMFS